MKATLKNLIYLLSGIMITTLVSATAPRSSVPYEVARKDAEKIASFRQEWTVHQGTGISMEPHYGKNSLLLVATVEYENIRPNMIAVYRDRDGDLVGHLVRSVRGSEIRTQGANNTNLDPNPVTPENLHGVVVGLIHAADSGPTTDLPVIVGKKY